MILNNKFGLYKGIPKIFDLYINPSFIFEFKKKVHRLENDFPSIENETS